MAREIQILDSASSVAESGALHFVRICNSSIKANGKFSVVLSGGSTPKGMLSLLATDEYKKQVPWDKCHFFWGDERSVPPTHADSNFKMATDSLLSHVPVIASQIYRMEAEKADINQAAQEYHALRYLIASLDRNVLANQPSPLLPKTKTPETWRRIH